MAVTERMTAHRNRGSVGASVTARGGRIDIVGDVTGLSIDQACQLLGDLERAIDLIEVDPFTSCMDRLDELNAEGAS